MSYLQDRSPRRRPEPLQSDTASAYTLRTVNTPLLSPHTPSYGSLPTEMPRSPGVPSKRLLLNAALKCAAIFIISSALLGGTLWLALPTLDEEDRPLLHIPKSFAQLQELNGLLKKYRDIYPFRIVVCYVVVYLFLQAFSLPGSMYLSILGGAVWGMARAIPLACSCVATGATLCYLLSAAFGPALLTLPKWRARLDGWSDRVEAQRSNIISFLVILRIAPLPPHWVVNVLCPHLRIGIVPFWISTFLGIMGVTIIHTAIGGGLDEMTSADDFNLISWRNFFFLAAIVFAVLIPVGLRHVFSSSIPPPMPPTPTPSTLEIDDTDRLSIESDELDAPLKTDSTGKLVFLVGEDDDDDDESRVRRDGSPDSDRILATGGPAESKP
ncbi:hypothetical protein SISSUDRAFT_1043127 [Sistotremastrum suecicum HHB10207 ss-3]|uniref:VTT domain-containing protein n=1 Tax=Sistotremastrum suecicum HHB10207 ss-3 TaxID=1314776 RepID=A0A166G450_9AGAM|nr:hypothetical protein SISSUDRAFT_1043127 [Sistotremastrum suecicum HHB10207 ss-3]